MGDHFHQWHAERYDAYKFGRETSEPTGKPAVAGERFTVTTERYGPNAIMLERALSFKGVLHRAVTTPGAGVKAHLDSVVVSFDDCDVEAGVLHTRPGPPAKAEQITANVRVTEDGKTYVAADVWK